MQSIYKNASLVLVWLGTEYGSSSLRTTIDALWRSFFKYLKIDPSTVDREWRPPGTSFIDNCDRLAPIFSEEQPEPPFDVASWEEVAQKSSAKHGGLVSGYSKRPHAIRSLLLVTVHLRTALIGLLCKNIYGSSMFMARDAEVLRMIIVVLYGGSTEQ